MRNSRSHTDVAMVAANSTCSGVPPNCGAMNLDVNVASRRHLQRLTNAHTIQVLHNRNPGLLSGDKFPSHCGELRITDEYEKPVVALALPTWLLSTFVKSMS